MNKKILLTICAITLVITACDKRENPLINEKALSTLHSIISAGKMPGECRQYFRSQKIDHSRKVKCDQKAADFFQGIKDKEPFLHARADDIKDHALWERFYTKYPDFDFFIG